MLPEDLGEQPPQLVVDLELALDLAQEGFGDRPVVTEDADGDLRIAQDVPDRQPEGDQARLPVPAAPQVEPSIGPITASNPSLRSISQAARRKLAPLAASLNIPVPIAAVRRPIQAGALR